jgi:hypothetical protein
MAEQKHAGGCHCGKVRYEATVDAGQPLECNCSHCSKLGLLLAFTTPDKFKLLKGEGAQTEYRFNKHVIQHLFCTACGVQSYANGKTKDGKDMVAINVRCLDGIDVAQLKTKPFDGRSL